MIDGTKSEGAAYLWTDLTIIRNDIRLGDKSLFFSSGNQLGKQNSEFHNKQ